MEYRRPTTDWFGLRDTLAAWGITPSVRYATNLQASVLGGRRLGHAYAGELSVDVDLNLDTLVGLRGLSFHASADWTSGDNLSADVGNVFIVAQFFEGRQARLYTLFVRQSLLDDRVDLKIGRFGTGDDFLGPPVGLSVVNEVLNPIVLALQQNVPGITADPNATWGGRMIVRPRATVSLAVGAFYSDPRRDQLTANGTEFEIDRKAGAFLVAEAAYYANQDRGATGLPGRYRLGGYYDSNRYAYLDDARHGERGNYGFYVIGEQIGASCRRATRTPPPSRPTTAASVARCPARRTSWRWSGRTRSRRHRGSRCSPTSSTSSDRPAGRASETRW
jgi:porin